MTRRAEEWISDKGDARGRSQVAILFNSSGFGERQVRIGTERGIGKWSVKGKGQQWAGRSCSIEVSIAATGRFGGIKLKRRTKEGNASRGERSML